MHKSGGYAVGDINIDQGDQAAILILLLDLYMPIHLFYELNKYEDIFYADPQHFGKEIFRHSNGNKLHKVQESAASAVDDKHQAGEG